MQLSYAQNLEDYHLDLVFGDQQTGTYVDVGGGHPVADNVSFWFYLKGWRGLIVEPQEALADIYAHVRPRDHTVSCLAGRSEGEAEFHVVDKLHGFSTTVRENAAGASQFGAGFTTVRKPVRTLAALCAEAGLTRIDFLKIDVEGAEAEVIAGMDFKRWRPRVVVVEAIAPGSMAESWQAWEPALLAAGLSRSRSSTASTASTWRRRRRRWRSAFRASPRPGTACSICGTSAARPKGRIIPTTRWPRCCRRASSPRCRRSTPPCSRGWWTSGLEATKAGAFGPAVAKSLIGTAELPRAPRLAAISRSCSTPTRCAPRSAASPAPMTAGTSWSEGAAAAPPPVCCAGNISCCRSLPRRAITAILPPQSRRPEPRVRSAGERQKGTFMWKSLFFGWSLAPSSAGWPTRS